MQRVSGTRTEPLAVHVLRRRDDGALRWWVQPMGDREAMPAVVARDLLRLLLAGETRWRKVAALLLTIRRA